MSNAVKILHRYPSQIICCWRREWQNIWT